MKLAVLADIHGNLVALQQAIGDAKSQGIHQFVVLGDIVMIGPDPGSVLHIIRELNPFCWIRGNTDMWFEEISDDTDPETLTQRDRELYAYIQFAKSNMKSDEIAFLNSLPMKRTISIDALKILCVHGSPRSVLEMMDGRRPVEELGQMVRGVTENVVLCGHSHHPYIGQVEGKAMFNVGSVGRPLDGDNSASYGIIDLSAPKKPKFEIRRVQYSITDTVSRAKKIGFPYTEKYEKVLMNAANS
ncbi:phosphodiesterase [Peptococcaceae bacterium CEB3]|nr:phosphodiesterase [Peptococcaceae bacterium CEB3]